MTESSSTNRLEKLADNASLRAWSRMAMLLTPLLLSVIGSLIIFVYMNDMTTIRQSIEAAKIERISNLSAISELKVGFAVMQAAQSSDRAALSRMDNKLDTLGLSLSTLNSNVASQSTAIQALVREVERGRD